MVPVPPAALRLRGAGPAAAPQHQLLPPETPGHGCKSASPTQRCSAPGCHWHMHASCLRTAGSPGRPGHGSGCCPLTDRSSAGTGSVDEGSLAACTQLTALRGCSWLPALTQLTQLLQLKVNQELTSDSLPLLATLPQLADLRLQFCPLHSSSQLSRFLFQHLTSLTVTSIHSRDLAALDCPQLQTLAVTQLQVDCAASLRACASGILQHCNDIYKLFTYNHGQEFKEAAAGAGVRQLGPPPSTSALLEALAPWQPRSGKAIERLGLWHLPDVTHEALKWLPVNIRSLHLGDCHLLPGALSSVATRLTQLTWLDLTSSPVALAELQLLVARAQQGASLQVWVPTTMSKDEVAALKSLTSYTQNWTGEPSIVVKTLF
ncbi:hypothetical protein HaLaN_18910 [Haematococcus lacustris]|uniref:Uncharacterized protein n=1 Tax=Haematococcus lacustris TaxID=44745 RepID=A0A699ZS53_HAELA|nr:hypothetical protein HaLaN_18910 [Haematococcus lacustris]